jgi:DNA processing protein
MALSLVCEPGDPRLPNLLAGREPAELLAAIRVGRRLDGIAVPQAWVHAAQDDTELERMRAAAKAAALRWLIPGDAGWPEQLGDLDHLPAVGGATGAPLGLWTRGRGRLDELLARSVAVVGARDCTAYGAEQAADIGAEIASAGLTVVSGAAFGIDACAHRGALAMLRPTVAVLACDAATAYPRAHAALLERISDEGLVVSEQPPGRVPTKARFLARNRLIAAMTGGTVVVEARRRSGALNTLGWADQLGRVTMAVPGPVTSQQSVGAHQAIRDGKAILVGSGSDVVAEMSDGIPAELSAPNSAFDALTSDQARVLDALDWSVARDADVVARTAGVDRATAVKALGVLGGAGWAVAVDQSRWLLARRADLEPGGPPRTVGE